MREVENEVEVPEDLMLAYNVPTGTNDGTIASHLGIYYEYDQTGNVVLFTYVVPAGEHQNADPWRFKGRVQQMDVLQEYLEGVRLAHGEEVAGNPAAYEKDPYAELNARVWPEWKGHRDGAGYLKPGSPDEVALETAYRIIHHGPNPWPDETTRVDLLNRLQEYMIYCGEEDNDYKKETE